MDDTKRSEGFHFTYSAQEQEELRAIRQKYLPPAEDGIQKVRHLDAGVTGKAMRISLMAGVTGALIMGVGMCCCMVWQGIWFIPGIIIGVVGMIAMGMAYPIYQRVVKKEREKIAPEILRLTEELLK